MAIGRHGGWKLKSAKTMHANHSVRARGRLVCRRFLDGFREGQIRKGKSRTSHLVSSPMTHGTITHSRKQIECDPNGLAGSCRSAWRLAIALPSIRK